MVVNHYVAAFVVCVDTLRAVTGSPTRTLLGHQPVTYFYSPGQADIQKLIL